MSERTEGQEGFATLASRRLRREAGRAPARARAAATGYDVVKTGITFFAHASRTLATGASFLASFLALIGLSLPAQAADSLKAVHFAPGTSSASVSGVVSGSDTAVYTLEARGGQTLTTVLTTSGSDACIFDVSKPDGAFLFNGTTGGSAFTGTLPADARYQISVFQMRAAILQGQSCRYTLAVSVN